MTSSYAKAMESSWKRKGAANGFIGLGMMNMASGGVLGMCLRIFITRLYQQPGGNASPPQDSSVICTGCSKPVNGKFCSNCGTPVLKETLSILQSGSFRKVFPTVEPV